MSKKKQNKPVQNRPNHNRKVAVFVSLFGALAVTCVVLVAIAPPPLTTAMWRSLFAVDAPESLDAIFQTEVAPDPGRWRYIYVHHSRTLGGNAGSLAKAAGTTDHFVIGNGDDCIDGEVQMTQCWNHQQAIPTPPAGVSVMDQDCISICMVGDFDRSGPTPTQLRRLTQLVGTLQSRLHIPSSQVITFDQQDSAAGIGHCFPAATFRGQILP